MTTLYTFDHFRIYVYITNVVASYGMSITTHNLMKIDEKRIIEVNYNKIRKILGWKKIILREILT